MTVKDLGYLEHKMGVFNLTHELSSIWKNIGKQLGVKEGDLEDLKASSDSDVERLNKVWIMWLDHSKELSSKTYPPSWKGLQKLLEDLSRGDIAKQYFEFIYRY